MRVKETFCFQERWSEIVQRRVTSWPIPISRGFLVYLALIAGVLILGDDPAQPTQKGYVGG